MPAPEKAVAVVPAAGAGLRMGTARPKQFLELDGKPLLARALAPFEACASITGIVLVVPREEVSFCRREIVGRFGLRKVLSITPGGDRRQDSVRLGLAAAAGCAPLVVIHDGVRPLLSLDLLEGLILAAGLHRAVIAGLPAKETVKEADPGHQVLRTLDRTRLWLIQTPQVFRFEDIAEAHRQALEAGIREAVDDALLVERLGIPVTVIPGREENIKVTTPFDLDLALLLMKRRTDQGVLGDSREEERPSHAP